MSTKRILRRTLGLLFIISGTTIRALDPDETYGCEANPTGSPIGGGEGYADILAAGDFTVKTKGELLTAFKQAKAGQVVFVPDGVEMDLTDLRVISIPAGVTLAGTRGLNESKGARLFAATQTSFTLLRTAGDDVRITGLRFEGPNAGTEITAGRSCFLYTQHYGFEIDNCEIYNFNTRGVAAGSGSFNVHVHHNYIHHIQLSGLGYGVRVDNCAVSIIANKFDYCRHHIASGGSPGCAYEAAWNLILPHATSHHFDMHGGRDRGDGTNIAGDWMRIHHNTFQDSHHRAVAVRGIPSDHVEIHHNWFFHKKPGPRVLLPWPAGGKTRVELHDNLYGRDAPALLDMRCKTFEQALKASLAVGSPVAVRFYLDKALELAESGAERSQARLEIGHTYYSEEFYAAARVEYEKVLAIPDASPEHLASARNRLKSSEIQETVNIQRAEDWRLVFSDDFERDSPGDSWKVISGNWKVKNGKLISSESGGGKIVLLKRIEGFHRLEFDAVSNAGRPCDLSPFIHSNTDQTSSSGSTPGYLFQFGASGNTINIFRRDGDRTDCATVSRLIQRGKVHKIVAEFDGVTLQLVVDGIPILQYREQIPLLGKGHDMVGFYIHGSGAIDNVRVYEGKGKSRTSRLSR